MEGDVTWQRAEVPAGARHGKEGVGAERQSLSLSFPAAGQRVAIADGRRWPAPTDLHCSSPKHPASLVRQHGKAERHEGRREGICLRLLPACCGSSSSCPTTPEP